MNPSSKQIDKFQSSSITTNRTHSNTEEQQPLQQIPLAPCNIPHKSTYLNQLNQPLSITTKSYSLQPDMASGWMPKLPSVPIPFKYGSSQSKCCVQKVFQTVQKDQRYQIVYRWKNKLYNSVKLHQQYEYRWEHRAKYEINLELLKNAVEKVGRPESQYALDYYSSQEIVQTEKKTAQTSTTSTNCEYLFDSNFQSGNLALAIKAKPNQFDCYIRNDSNTNGHTNWFYFSIENGSRVGKIKLNICNIKKSKLLYQKGMQPFVKLQGSNEEFKQGLCSDVIFVERYCRYRQNCKQYQLQFTYNFQEPNQKVYFSYGIPYTYSRLQSFITEISTNTTNNNPHNTQISTTQTESPLSIEIQSLGESYSSINIPLIKISSKKSSPQVNSNISTINSISRPEPITTAKQAIILMGRIHPGQTNSSFILEGFIRQIIAKRALDPTNNDCRINSADIRSALLDKYDFYIIPMLNVDGVVLGNFRCGAQGYDINRQFYTKKCSKLQEQKQTQTKNCQQATLVIDLVKKILSSGKQIALFVDFHGHSSKENCFFYGPQDKNPHKSPSLSSSIKFSSTFIKSRILAKLFQQKCPSFLYSNCSFSIPKYKKCTARGYINQQLSVPMTFTLETSNGLYKQTNHSSMSFGSSKSQSQLYGHVEFQSIGAQFVKVIKSYTDLEVCLRKSSKNYSSTTVSQSKTKSKKQLKRSSLNQSQSKRALIKRTSLNFMRIFHPQNETASTANQEKLKNLLQQIKEDKNSTSQQKGPTNQPQSQSKSDVDSSEDDLSVGQQRQLFRQSKEWKEYFNIDTDIDTDTGRNNRILEKSTTSNQVQAKYQKASGSSSLFQLSNEAKLLRAKQNQQSKPSFNSNKQPLHKKYSLQRKASFEAKQSLEEISQKTSFPQTPPPTSLHHQRRQTSTAHFSPFSNRSNLFTRYSIKKYQTGNPKNHNISCSYSQLSKKQFLRDDPNIKIQKTEETVLHIVQSQKPKRFKENSHNQKHASESGIMEGRNIKNSLWMGNQQKLLRSKRFPLINFESY